MSANGVDRDTSPAAAAAAAAAASGGTATAEPVLIAAPTGGVTDNAVVRWDGTTGLLVQDSSATLTDAGLLTVSSFSTAAATITGGSITGITDLAVADGGTGASTAAGARTNLGLAIGSDVQGYSANLAAIAALAVTDGNIIVGNGSAWVAESGATARTSLGLGTGDSPQFTGIEVGHASDTTVTRGGSGWLAVEGKSIPRVSTGTTTPATTPSFVGELFIDTSNAKAFVSTGTASSADWEQIDGGAGGGSSTISVQQSAHGFAAGNAVRVLSNNVYTKAQADSAANAEVVGVVSEVTNASNCVITTSGPITGVFSGLTPGAVYFLDPSTAGATTATEPTTVGQISKPVMIAYASNAVVVTNMRGVTVGSATSTLAQSITSGDGSTTAFTLPATPVHENNVLVFISGVWQQRDTYSVSGATLTFSAAPPSGTNNIEFVVVGSVSIGTASATDAGATLTLGTEQASTSGTAIDFTGIPAGTKQIIVGFDAVNTNGTSHLLVQIGDSGGIEATSYVSASYIILDSTNTFATGSITTGFVIFNNNASFAVNGQMILTLEDATNNVWVAQFGGAWVGASTYAMGAGGRKALSATLDRIRVTSVSGDTFSAGGINIAYK